MEKRESSRILFIIVLALMTADSCLQTQMFYIGGLGIYYHLFTKTAIIALGALVFMIRPRLDRLMALWKQVWILLLPILMPAAWSVFPWIAGTAENSEVRRGFVLIGYLFFGVLAMAFSAYMMGEKAALMYLCSLLFSNLYAIVIVVRDNGLVAFLDEFRILLMTLSVTTGDIMKQLEIHRITYGIGPFLVFFLVQKKEMRKGWPLFLVALFCFLTGLKRIASVAVIVAVVIGNLFLLFRRFRGVERAILKTMGVLFPILAFAYVAAVHFGLYDYLESLGLDFNYRAEINRYWGQYATMSPLFFGNGTGWVENLFQMWNSGQLKAPAMGAYISHNDYLRNYIELGMVGFFIWCYLRCNYQVKKAFDILGEEGGILALSMIIYMAITWIADPTSTQIYINCAVCVSLLSYHLREREKQCREVLELNNRMRCEPEWDSAQRTDYVKARRKIENESAEGQRDRSDLSGREISPGVFGIPYGTDVKRN